MRSITEWQHPVFPEKKIRACCSNSVQSRFLFTAMKSVQNYWSGKNQLATSFGGDAGISHSQWVFPPAGQEGLVNCPLRRAAPQSGRWQHITLWDNGLVARSFKSQPNWLREITGSAETLFLCHVTVSLLPAVLLSSIGYKLPIPGFPCQITTYLLPSFPPLTTTSLYSSNTTCFCCGFIPVILFLKRQQAVIEHNDCPLGKGNGRRCF